MLKPIGETYRSRTLNTDRREVTDVELAPATQDEVDATVSVMGGEDWRLWMDALTDGGCSPQTAGHSRTATSDPS